MNPKTLSLFVFAILLIAGIYVRIGFNSAEAQPIPLEPRAATYVAPGFSAYSTAISCSNAGTTIFEHDGTGAGNVVADILPIPEGTRMVIQNLTAGVNANCCWTVDPQATVGDPTAVGTLNELGGARASCLVVQGGSDWPEVFNFSRWPSSSAGFGNRVCNVASPHEFTFESGDGAAGFSYEAYAGCLADGDCASTAGMGAGATCLPLASIGSVLRPDLTVSPPLHRYRSAYLACRCSGATILELSVVHGPQPGQ